MTSHRRYRFEHLELSSDWQRERVQEVLLEACERHWWFSDPETEKGQPGAPWLAFSVTVAGRDQWWCHRRATDLAVVAFATINIPLSEVPVPTWQALAPHTNRGRKVAA